jgi:uncharacterized membrane protein
MDEQQGQQGEQAPQGEQHETPKIDLDPAAPEQYASVPAQEIADGKAMAILSYVINFVSLPFFIIPLVIRNNEFALFHAKQSLMIWIIGAVGYAVGSILTLVCIGVVVIIAVFVFVVVVNIIGIINAVNGQFKPLPVIGTYAEKWFAGIKKVPAAS